MFLGIDIGSSSTKAAIINEEKELVAVSVRNLGTGTDAHEEVISECLKKAGITWDDVKYVLATGYGRITYEKANKQITEITCHAVGTTFLLDGIKSIIDIGGQDAKIIRLDGSGNVENFVMNEKCAAGTGRFLEVMSRVLGCKLDELSEMATKSTENISINNVCTVFAESEVISRLASGESRFNVARGAHIAIAKRIAGMCARLGLREDVAITGGVALNKDLVDMLSNEIGMPIKIVPECQAVGAIGAAVLAEKYYRQKNLRL